MNFSPQERSLLGRLADVLIPAGNGFPSASQAGVGTDGLDQVLKVRPELGPGLKTILDQVVTKDPAAFVAELQRSDPDAFGVLAEWVPGAYFLCPAVRAQLGYDGQSARPISPEPEPLDPLLQPVLNRGPIYRPTGG